MSKFLLKRLYNASRAYYLMRELGECEESTPDDIKNEMAAALVDVKISCTNLDGKIDFDDLKHRADRTKEWIAAKMIFGEKLDMGDLLKP